MDLADQLLKLRKVRQEDRELIWEWANDPQVRAASFSSNLIAWQDHVQWFENKLRDLNVRFYMAVDANNLPIGQVRFDIRNNEAIISISIGQQFRHQGYGYQIIQLAAAKIRQDSTIKIVHAHIKSSNLSSIRAFTKAGFRHNKAIEIHDNQSMQLLLELENNQ